MAAVNIREIWKGHPADRSWLVGQHRAQTYVLPGRWVGGRQHKQPQWGSLAFLSWLIQVPMLKMWFSKCHSQWVLPFRTDVWFDTPNLPPVSLSEGWAMCLSLLPQTEPRAFDQVVRLVGTGPQPSHSVFIGRNWMVMQGPHHLVHRETEKVEGLGVPRVGRAGGTPCQGLILHFLS